MNKSFNRQWLGSFLAALVGWFAPLGWSMLRSGLPKSTEGLSTLIGMTISFLIVFVVWLVALVPLYMLVPRSSLLWRWPICTSCGAVAGAAIMFATDIRHFLQDPSNNLILTAAVIGGTTCLFGSLTRDFFHRDNGDNRNATPSMKCVK